MARLRASRVRPGGEPSYGHPSQGLYDRERRAADRGGRAPPAARALPARPPRVDRHPRRLRHVQLRRVHRPPERRRGEVVHGPRGPGRRRPGHDDRGHRLRGRAASGARGLLGAPWPAVRLLHAGDDHGRRRPASQEPGPGRGGRARGAGGKSLPLHGLPQHRQGGHVRRAGPVVLGGAGMTAVEQPPTQKWVGQSMRRKEDPRMITGRGRYVDDMVVAGMLYMAVVRSPEAHARIVSIDAPAAKQLPGVHGVFPGEALDFGAGLPMVWVPPGAEINSPEHWPLAKGAVKYVGQGVAVVVGDDKYAVVDAAEQVLVEYEPLPVVVDSEKALEPGSPLVHEEFGTNQTHEWTIGGGDMDAAWAEADVVIERRIVNHRTAGTPIQSGAGGADFRAGALTLHLTSQNPHLTRLFMSGEFGISEDKIRVIAPDVGGGFGVKIMHYPEEVIASWASRKLNRPVKWTETRSEHMTSTIHGRDQIDYVKIGAKRDGTITGLECTAICDLGAYFETLTPFIPCFTGFVISGCYKIPNLKFTARGVFTNKMATDATRGAGRPEATHLIEVTVEQLAAELGMDSLELRRKNFI